MIGRYFTLLGLVLMGYAIFGRGFAYLGKPPLFVGEAVLMLGVFIMSITRGSMRVFALPQMSLILLFMLWGLCRMVPYLTEWGMFALRDSVVWGYAVFAIITAALLLAEPHRLPRLLWQYRGFALAFLILVPLLIVIKGLFRGALPDVPGTSIAIFAPRRGNIMVHMAVICAFVIAGFAHRRTLAIAVFSIPFMLLLGSNRAGILSFCVAVGMATVLTRINKKSVNLWGSILVVIAIVGVVGANATIPGSDQAINTDQLVEKVLGIVGLSNSSRNINSADWRLNWWGDILNYTVNGTHFWTGKGFGVNLATDDGYQVDAEGDLRSPHSIHFNILARMGVPGALLWLALQASWAVPLFRRYLECRRVQDPRWSGVFLVLLTYWVATMVNSSFDVDLEGPMGGIWFWAVFGIGMATLVIHRTHPLLMYQDAQWERYYQEQLRPRTRSAWIAETAAANWQRPAGVR